jgi:hypothetical protein
LPPQAAARLASHLADNSRLPMENEAQGLFAAQKTG